MRRWSCFFCILAVPFASLAQTQLPEWKATQAIFPEAGLQVSAVRLDAAGRYLILHSRPATLFVFDASLKLVGKYVPQTGQDTTSLAEDFTVGPDGKIYVADRGARAIKVLSASGEPLPAIPFPQPVSVVATREGDLFVSSAQTSVLVTAVDASGKVRREFGALYEFGDRADVQRTFNIGLLRQDAAGNIYYLFRYLPTPTVHKYSPLGHRVAEFELIGTSLPRPQPPPPKEPFPATPPPRVSKTERILQRAAAMTARDVLTALAVNPQSEALWVGAGASLLHYDREGRALGEWQALDPASEPLPIDDLLIGPDRVIVVSTGRGVFLFPLPSASR
jgi:hypothetical protein